MPPLRCNFCRRSREDVRSLVVAPRERYAEPLVAICDECAGEAVLVAAGNVISQRMIAVDSAGRWRE